jgi:hypothetical protein
VPPKAAYLALQNGDVAEFTFYLAMKLSMTVAELEERMAHSEYVLWNAYFSRVAQRKQLAAGNG